MNSARDAAAASDAVISPRPWATLRESPPGWLCPIGFKLGVGETFEGPFAEIFDPSEETEKLLVSSASITTRLEQAARMPGSLARLTICFPAVGTFIGGACATMSVGESFAATALVHVCMCSLVLKYQVSSYYMFLR